MERLAHYVGAGLLVIGWGLLVAPAVLAQASECRTDADCGPGAACISVSVPAIPCASGEQCPPPAEPIGLCAEGFNPCSTDADCPAGFECSLLAFATAACPPGADCVQPDVIAPDGMCELSPMDCMIDDDCLEGLVCELEAGGSSCSASDNGDVTCPEPAEATRGECDFSPAQCTDDSECGPLEVCESLGVGSQSCSDSGSACAPGEECIEEEPECTGGEEETACLPAFMPCEVDEECPVRWGCLSFDRLGRDKLPTFWDTANAEGACLPEGLLLVAGEDGSAGGGSSASKGSSSDTLTRSDGNAGTDDDTDAADASMKGDGLCAVQSKSAPGDGAWFALPLAWLLTRRRRARRSACWRNT